MLCTVEHYQIITNDTISATADVDNALTRAQNLLEESLGRPHLLEWGEHTETLRLYPDGTVYPTCTPVDTAGTLTVINDVIYGAAVDPLTSFDAWVAPCPMVSTVTYQGGYGAGDDVPLRNLTPQCIIDDLAWVALQLLQASPSSELPPGAVSVSSGDQAVVFRDPVTTRLRVTWSCDVERYGRR